MTNHDVENWRNNIDDSSCLRQSKPMVAVFMEKNYIPLYRDNDGKVIIIISNKTAFTS